ncbi:MAG: histidine kinase [Verrucomicrobia bacterium]|nr:histidine kinase [Verrucomicrobiota bacterium]MCH8528700.1 histidine kinase [Kiritimatiellia bacterium]
MKRPICFSGGAIRIILFLCVFGARAESGPALGSPMLYYLDSTGALNLDDVLEGSGTADFSPAPSSIPSFGFTGDRVWLRLDLGAEADAERMRLFSLRTARLREVDWYLVQDQRLIQHRAEGIDRPPPEDFRGRYPAFLAELPAGDAVTLYVRVRSDSSIWLPLHWAPLGAMLEMDMRWNFLEQAFLGFGFAMVIISILVSLAHPGGGFVRLAGITFCFLGYHLLFHGYLDWWIPGLPAWFHRHLLLVCAAGSSLFMLLFTQKYFTDKDVGRVSRWLLTRSPLVCLLLVVILSAVPFQAAAHLTLLLVLWAYGFGLLLSGRMLYRYRTLGDLCFTLAWFLTALTIVAFALQIHFPVSGPLHPLNITRMLIPMMYLFFLAANLRRQRNLLDEKEQLLKARQAGTRAHLDALRYQLNPHFLFNALNSIEALALEDPGKIPLLVRRLATVLRLRLKPSKGGLNSLKEELHMVRAYLDIEKIRFEERLEIEWRLSAENHEVPVPEMILQPMIENAVKYGMMMNEEMKIRIVTAERDGTLCLQVWNKGRLIRNPAANESGNGIGLNNLQTRLRFHYGEKAGFMLREGSGWVIAEVEIPLSLKPNESTADFNY